MEEQKKSSSLELTCATTNCWVLFVCKFAFSFSPEILIYPSKFLLAKVNFLILDVNFTNKFAKSKINIEKRYCCSVLPIFFSWYFNLSHMARNILFVPDNIDINWHFYSIGFHLVNQGKLIKMWSSLIWFSYHDIERDIFALHDKGYCFNNCGFVQNILTIENYLVKKMSG